MYRNCQTVRDTEKQKNRQQGRRGRTKKTKKLKEREGGWTERERGGWGAGKREIDRVIEIDRGRAAETDN